MKFLQVFMLISLLTLVSCSSGKKSKTAKEGENQIAEMEEDADFIVDADNEELIIEEEGPAQEQAVSEPVFAQEPESVESVASVTPEPIVNGDTAEYIVKKGDTLMLVAFSVYGDYRKWRDLKTLNGLSSSDISEGMVIKYQKPEQPFVWNPEGLPYLIKRGDSLVSISKSKYGTTRKWKSIYDNNQPMIRDPNLIFAGFTLYYIPERELASE